MLGNTITGKFLGMPIVTYDNTGNVVNQYPQIFYYPGGPDGSNKQWQFLPAETGYRWVFSPIWTPLTLGAGILLLVKGHPLLGAALIGWNLIPFKPW